MMARDLQWHRVGKHQIIIDQRIGTLSANTKGEVGDRKRRYRESCSSSWSNPPQRKRELSPRRDDGQPFLRDPRVVRVSFLELQNYSICLTQTLKEHF